MADSLRSAASSGKETFPSLETSKGENPFFPPHILIGDNTDTGMIPELHNTERTCAGVILRLASGRELRHLVDEVFAWPDAVFYIDPTWNEWHSHHPEHCFRGCWSGNLFIPDVDDIRSIEFVPTDVERWAERQRETLQAIAEKRYKQLLTEDTSNAERP